ncbi:MAG: glutamate-1-semialdehyde 2,1-aminomutase [Firmicutes bacterium]|nr:glutamate-1-semialdehyde 2,1-aminomutase [Bacillota bacterium]
MKTIVSKELRERAVKVMPGGVNSPVRAYYAVKEIPRFIERAKGAYIYDSDGNKYTDYIGSWGPMILGHNDERIVEAVKKQLEKGMSYGASTQLEVEMAELITSLVPWCERVRMVNSGTEAVMSAVRLARGFTCRDKIIKFDGCYHGHSDMLLVKAGSGVLTQGIPDSAGVPANCTADTLTAKYNDMSSVQSLFEEYPNDIACVVIEPVAGNMGVVLPKDGFLKDLRKLCTKHGTLLIFDEVITGFRLGTDGAAGRFGITPDLVTYGKIIGGGMPVGAYGGRRDIMNCVAPEGNVYQAGTLSGNPVAMAAGITQLKILNEDKNIYANIEVLGERLRNGIKNAAHNAGVNVTVNGIGSLSTLFFCKNEVTDYESALKSDTKAYSEYFSHMLNSGNFIAPSQFEAMFVSAVHTENDIDKTINDIQKFFDSIKN